ncbi:hypothetical protein niasHT_013721 [Heterodera trifolii]|uniref:Uncharacterized protein n=1 Tax=Heterodera trifolii TaxID=157864 RepID=A0ABD2LBY5_9BILA
MAHLDEIELDLEELQEMENEGRTDQTPVQELSVGIGKGLAHRAGRIVFNAPIVFLGDQRVEPLALLFQTNGLRAMVIIKLLTDVIWWQKLSGRAVINDICRMVVLRAEMWAECFLPFVGQLCEQWRRTGRRVVWFGKPINIHGLIWSDTVFIGGFQPGPF